jgi:hypothetical protein
MSDERALTFRMLNQEEIDRHEELVASDMWGGVFLNGTLVAATDDYGTATVFDTRFKKEAVEETVERVWNLMMFT